MKVVLFCHSLVSDWNHGNAHFLRGIVSELLQRGQSVSVYEPFQAWSREQLVRDHGQGPIEEFYDRYPTLRSHRYDEETFDFEAALEGADLVIVHEWNSSWVVQKIGEAKKNGGSFKLLFHDTHHRIVTAFDEMKKFDLRNYDGVLGFGKVICDLYREHGLTEKAWVWHEAADTRTFTPLPGAEKTGDLVWIGNWGDEERTEELREFLIQPAAELGFKARIHGVRYPDYAQEWIKRAGIEYQGWIANFHAPRVLSQFHLTVHVPRRPYVEALPGIPTIRVFEALACGIPLISAPWNDSEGLFVQGKDYLTANNGKQMQSLMKEVVHNPGLREELSTHGLQTIHKRHSCSRRVDELLKIYNDLAHPEKIVSSQEEKPLCVGLSLDPV